MPTGRGVVLLSGVALNWSGAVKLARDVWPSGPRAGTPDDSDQLKAFTAGTAATFGAAYLHLFVSRKPLVPQLVFGAALKTWALVLSAILLVQGRLRWRDFLSFGVTNGLVAGLFWSEILRELRDSPSPTKEHHESA